MTHTLTRRERTARQISIAALLLAALVWLPTPFVRPPIAVASLMGYLPWPSGSPDIYFASRWIPIAVLGTLAALGWIKRSKTFAISALLMPFVGFAIFIVRYGIGMGAFS